MRSSRVAREDLGLEYRQNVLCGPGPARTGWWREPYGPTGGGREYCGRSAAQACRAYLVGLYIEYAVLDAEAAWLRSINNRR